MSKVWILQLKLILPPSSLTKCIFESDSFFYRFSSHKCTMRYRALRYVAIDFFIFVAIIVFLLYYYFLLIFCCFTAARRCLAFVGYIFANPRYSSRWWQKYNSFSFQVSVAIFTMCQLTLRKHLVFLIHCGDIAQRSSSLFRNDVRRRV